jgi:hypothetical protein
MRCIVNSRRPHRPHQILHSVKASYRLTARHPIPRGLRLRLCLCVTVTSTPARRSTKCDATPRRAAPMWRCVSPPGRLLLIHARLAREGGDVAVPGRGGASRHLTSPPRSRLAFLTRLLRLHHSASRRPAVHVTPRLLPFASASLLPLVVFPTSPGIWPRTYLSPAPLARWLPSPSPLSLSCGRGGWWWWWAFFFLCVCVFSDQGKGEEKKKRALFLRPAVSLSLARWLTLKRLIRAFLVCGQASDCGARA